MFYLGITVAIVMLHNHESGEKETDGLRQNLREVCVEAAGIAVVLVISVTGASMRTSVGIEALLWGLHPEVGSMTVSLAANQPFTLGVYDPQQAFANAGNIGIDHIFVSWVDNEQERIPKGL